MVQWRPAPLGSTAPVVPTELLSKEDLRNYKYNTRIGAAIFSTISGSCLIVNPQALSPKMLLAAVIP